MVSVRAFSPAVCMSIARKAFIAAVLPVFAVFASSGAQAQNCGPLDSTLDNIGDAKFLFGGAIAGASAIAGAINATNTAFLTHSTAFVSAPGNPPPDSQGGGVWIRGVGGESTTKSDGTASFNIAATPGGFPGSRGSTNCNSTFKQNFAGVQLGTDISRLNIGGWNIHLGATAGYLGTKGDINEGATPTGGPFNTKTQAPFIGSYAAATYGGFFIDGLLRFNYYETSLDSPSINIFNQKVDAHGVSLGGSAGYHWTVPNSNWFVEPAAGIVWSRVSIDSLQLTGGDSPGGNFKGTAQISDITNTIGRAGLRVGTTVDTGNMILQPFASVNVLHDFNGSWSASYSSCPNCIFVSHNGGPFQPTQLTASMEGSGVGTYGTYSLGVAGRSKNTGWLGYLRVDYTNGSNLEGWTGSGGIRYQFTPEAPRTAMITKAPVKVQAGSVPVNWTGFYIGGFGGAGYGHGDPTFAPAVGNPVTVLPFPGLTADNRIAGFLGGGAIGYNYQMGAWVWGAEADVAWTNAKGSVACGNLVGGEFPDSPINAFFNSTCHDNLDWLATITGRLGYAWGRALYYAKAGAAWTHEEFSVTCNNGPTNGNVASQSCYDPAGNLFNTISGSDTRVGWTVGFGAEFALTDKWSAKAETEYLSFGSRGLTLSDGTIVNTKPNLWATKIGVNYRFSSM
jgi:opacity protein-like surface antigen